jgi:CrcB protein
VALVGAGGFFGAVLRYGLSGLVHRSEVLSSFPFGTLTVNVAGCVLFGGVMGLAESRQLLDPDLRAFVLIGALGGFTTFSTLGWETFAMLRGGEQLHALLNVGAHVVLGLAAVWLGFTVAASR